MNTKGIILTLIGGLGNQLFVYAVALACKKMFDVPVFLLLAPSTKDHSHRDYQILMDSVTPAAYDDMFVDSSEPFNMPNQNPHDDYDLNDIPVENDSYLRIGIHCFQRYERIKDTIGEVKESILSKWENKLVEDSNASAFIHVRRGDYLTYRDGECMISSEFYKKGLDVLNSFDKIKVIYIVSDDIAWCKEQEWPSSKSIVFYDEPDELKTLYLMSQCWAGAVIANSTFSLWGVFLGAYEKTDMIVYPSTIHFLKDLPASWIKI